MWVPLPNLSRNLKEAQGNQTLDSHQNAKEVTCLILLVPVKFPGLILAPEVALLRDPSETEEKEKKKKEREEKKHCFSAICSP